MPDHYCANCKRPDYECKCGLGPCPRCGRAWDNCEHERCISCGEIVTVAGHELCFACTYDL